MKEIDLSRCKSGILELTGRTGVTSLQGIFGVDVVDGEDKSEENEEEGDVEILPVSPSHRIP